MTTGTTTRLAPVLLLGMLAALGPLSIDLYLPAFPQLQHDLGAGDAAVQFTLAGMTIGLALGELVVGSWSDRVGRRRPLLLANGLHLVATLGCAAAPSVEVLAAVRVVQGIGAAGSAVLVLAMARDVADGPGLLRLLSRITLVTTTVPLLAPVAGAVLLPIVGWRGIFLALAAVSAAVLAACVVAAPDTRGPHTSTGGLRERARAVWRDPAFRRGTLVASMTYAAVYAYVAASPLLLQGVFGMDATGFALVFLSTSLCLVIGVQLAGWLGRTMPAPRVLLWSVAVAVIGAAAIVPLTWTGTGLTGLLPCLWLYVAGCGGCFPCATAIALENQGDQAGTATSVHGFVNFTVAGLASPIAGLIGITSAIPVAGVLLVISSVSLIGAAAILRLDRSGERRHRHNGRP
ncbi:DHA1 family bicyclomycin/chloramphenicol resistance-like MFS transporter [Diaminobutyricimonas aerilata]|uniref:DHA1 family bicyclomycin/chloramphenicol resistance-like MFS transporter n=1 Tax=Diaminobutyricimonas aerilata TaxID=1162967 RepID=A0A2M9CFY1_9MICO|nr:Bcr/CflA family efflux MFS transporter [Diaminobutyricimonas aerilata]PJJ70841.1 DHA1 family bicyclomycin/chloramphenicol resistance-like MFS transporter [Diaminobutyricimonas aerilata]